MRKDFSTLILCKTQPGCVSLGYRFLDTLFILIEEIESLGIRPLQFVSRDSLSAEPTGTSPLVSRK